MADRPAFDAREVRHMGDVRRVLHGFLIAWLIGLALLGIGVLTLRRSGDAVRPALRRGARVTLGLFAGLAVLMTAAFSLVFEALHLTLFEGESWRFGSDDTLRSLYPDAFWAIAGGVVAAFVVAQALTLVLATRTRARGRWRDPDSNRGHHDFQSCALPTELSRRGRQSSAATAAQAAPQGVRAPPTP